MAITATPPSVPTPNPNDGEQHAPGDKEMTLLEHLDELRSRLVASVVFCYFLMLPFSIAFLGGFQTDIFDQNWAAERYLDFVTTFMFWVGLTFELPIVMYFLSKMGVVSVQRMARFRKYAFVLAFVI